MIKRLLIIFICLSMATMACSITVDLPKWNVEPGPVQKAEIEVPNPDEETAEVSILFAGGELNLSGGEKEFLVSGTASYNYEELKPVIQADGNRVEIRSGDIDFDSLPQLRGEIENRWDLKVGDKPLDLRVLAGAYQGDYDMGGVALQALEISDGATTVDVDFSSPNKAEMTTFRYTTGASTARLKNLANANFTTMIFRSGAGDYTLDFSGELNHDASVNIESGISTIRIIVPEGTSARVSFHGGLSDVETSGKWERTGEDYVLEGDGPTLIINVDMGMGTLILRAD